MKEILAVAVFALIAVAIATPSFAKESKWEGVLTPLQKQQAENMARAQKELRTNSCLGCHFRNDGPAPLPPNGPPTCQSCHYQLVYGGRMGVSPISPFVPHD